jgi:hypothetical protein
MIRKNAKKMAFVGGIATIIGAATAAEKGRGWRDIHKIAAVVGLGSLLAKVFA